MSVGTSGPPPAVVHTSDAALIAWYRRRTFVFLPLVQIAAVAVSMHNA